MCVCVCAECVLNKMAQAMGSIRVFWLHGCICVYMPWLFIDRESLEGFYGLSFWFKTISLDGSSLHYKSV